MAVPRIPGCRNAQGAELPVLPGESLAKYSRSGIQPLDEAEEEEIRSLQPVDEVGHQLRVGDRDGALAAEEDVCEQDRSA